MSPDVAALEARNTAERIMSELHEQSMNEGESRLRSQLVRYSSQARLARRDARWVEEQAS